MFDLEKISVSQMSDLLYQEVFNMLIYAGFPEEDFFIKVIDDEIKVMFDSKEAVDYFRGDFDYSHLSKTKRFIYRKEGKRHCAIII